MEGQIDEATFVFDVLASLLHLSGFGSDSNNPRQTLVMLMKKFSVQLAEFNLRENNTIEFNEEESMYLVKIENSLMGIRRQLREYERTLEEELSESLSIQQELEMNKNVSMATNYHAVLCLSLVGAINDQIRLEQRSMHSLQYSLDDIYNENKASRLQTQLNGFRRTLSRRTIHEQLDYQIAWKLLCNQGNFAYVEGILRATGYLNKNKLEQAMGRLDHRRTDETVRTVGGDSVIETVSLFLDDSVTMPTESSLTVLLVVGDEGQGKTYLCDAVETMVKDSAVVVRPLIPLDLLGSSVGDSENCLVSIFGTIINQKGRKVVLLDGVDSICEQDEKPSHAQCRMQATLVSALDALEHSLSTGDHVFVLGFARTNCQAFALRCNDVFFLGEPSAKERESLIMSLLVTNQSVAEDNALQTSCSETDSLIDHVVEATIGKSYAELYQYCRQAVEVSAAKEENKSCHHVLQNLLVRLSSMPPASLRNSLIDDLVDMRVMTASDLLSGVSRPNDADSFVTQLRGESAKNAWKELVGAIVIPLCRSGTFHKLMGDSEDTQPTQKLFSGGVLLTGASYSGKSFLADQCARYAASLHSSIKLLDVSCTSLIHKEVGGSERAVHHLFECARKATPCILLLDAIENIAAVRGNDTTTEGTLDRVLSTLLVQLDGVDEYKGTANGGIAVIGITHDAMLVDSALKRPGRLDKVIELTRDW